MGLSRALGSALALTLFAASAGCVHRPAENSLIDEPDLTVLLRERPSAGGPAFSHPASISPQRAARILAALFVADRQRKGLESRRNAVHPDLVPRLAAALSSALAQAGPRQELAMMAVRKERRLGLFHRKFLTSFVAWVEGDTLVLRFSRIDWSVPKGREDRLPRPRIRDAGMPFRTVRGDAIRPVGPFTVEVNWRSERFAG